MADKAKVGNFDLTTVIDMVPPSREPSAMFPEVPAGDWDAYKDTLEDGRLQLYYGVVVMVGEGKTILVDTGMGPGPHPDRGNLTGNLYDLVSDVLAPPDNTRNTNVSPSDQVNFVIHTHLHADHVGWNLRYSGGMPAPNFRRARYIISKTEYDYYTEEKMLAQTPHVQRQVIPLRRLRLQQIVEGEHEVTEGIMVVPAPGHTPGHQVVLINSGGQKGMVAGDLLHNIAQVSESSWCAGVDWDKSVSAQSREKLLDLAEKENWIVAAGHFPPGKQIGKVV
ncbi:MAG: MBL fold metallo-hydrolase, partial [Chloroflexi bacterium]|nr:MBL fold metallo-hydrolase [Chloroflexota bacterium]